MKYKFLFFDADNTILDFDKAEEDALSFSLKFFDVPCNMNILQEYRKINISLWEKLEKGLITRDEVLFDRFALTFEKFGIDVEKSIQHKISDLYTLELHKGYATVEHAEEVLCKLKDLGYRLFVVSNGILTIQNERMRGSGLDKYFEKRFISEEIGFNKPAKEFFDLAFAKIDNFEKASSLIIGDSLTSDIKGGINAGIDTCWFNPKHKINDRGVVPNFEIDELVQLFDIV